MAVGEILLEALAYVLGDVLGELVRKPAMQLKLTVGEESLVMRRKMGLEVVRFGTQLRFTRDFDGMPRIRAFGDLDPRPDTPVETQLSLGQVLRGDALLFDEVVVLLSIGRLGYAHRLPALIGGRRSDPKRSDPSRIWNGIFLGNTEGCQLCSGSYPVV